MEVHTMKVGDMFFYCGVTVRVLRVRDGKVKLGFVTPDGFRAIAEVEENPQDSSESELTSDRKPA